MKIIALFLSLTLVSLTLAACGSDRTVVVQPQPQQVDHVIVTHDAN